MGESTSFVKFHLGRGSETSVAFALVLVLFAKRLCGVLLCYDFFVNIFLCDGGFEHGTWKHLPQSPIFFVTFFRFEKTAMRWHVLMRFWNCFCLFLDHVRFYFQVRWGIHFCWTFQHPRELYSVLWEPSKKVPNLETCPFAQQKELKLTQPEG